MFGDGVQRHHFTIFSGIGTVKMPVLADISLTNHDEGALMDRKRVLILIALVVLIINLWLANTVLTPKESDSLKKIKPNNAVAEQIKEKMPENYVIKPVKAVEKVAK